jgi:hypothetical protein
LDENCIHWKNVVDTIETFLGSERTVVVVAQQQQPPQPQQCHGRRAATDPSRLGTRRQFSQSDAWPLVDRHRCVACRDDVARRLCGTRHEFAARRSTCSGPQQRCCCRCRVAAGPRVRRDRHRVPFSKDSRCCSRRSRTASLIHSNEQCALDRDDGSTRKDVSLVLLDTWNEMVQGRCCEPGQLLIVCVRCAACNFLYNFVGNIFRPIRLGLRATPFPEIIVKRSRFVDRRSWVPL